MNMMPIGKTHPGLLQLKRAFTLIELLVVIAIIAILAALLVPAVQLALGQGMAAHCASNMHQIYLSMYQWNQDNDQIEPIPSGNSYGDWMFIEKSEVVDRLLVGDSYLSNASIFFCPQHGVSADDYYGYVFQYPVAVHGTYIWIYQKNDDDSRGRGLSNYARDEGYERSLMIDSGDIMPSVYGFGGMRGEHYNLLHYAGNVEVNVGKTVQEAFKKVGLEKSAPVVDYHERE